MTAELAMNLLVNSIFIGLVGWHVWLFLSAIWEPGARFPKLAAAHPAENPPTTIPALGGWTPGSGALLPFGAWFETAVTFCDQGMLAEYKGQRAFVPWSQLRLFGTAPLMVVVEVIPEQTRFAFLRPFFRRKVLRKLREASAPKAAH